MIAAVITTRRLRSVTNCFVSSLAAADLLVGLAVMPPAVLLQVRVRSRPLISDRALAVRAAMFREIGRNGAALQRPGAGGHSGHIRSSPRCAPIVIAIAAG